MSVQRACSLSNTKKSGTKNGRGVGNRMDQRHHLFLARQRQRDIRVVHAAVLCELNQRRESAALDGATEKYIL